MAEYQDRENVRSRLHEIAGELEGGAGAHGREADGFSLMYLLGTTDMNADEAIHAMEANERQAGSAASGGQGFLDSILDEMADALRTHDLSAEAGLEEDTAYWGKIVGTAAEKLDESRRQRMREEDLKQQQIHRELLKASAISCLEIRGMVCGEFNPYRRVFGNLMGEQFEDLMDSLGDLAGTVTETVIDMVDEGVKKVVGAGPEKTEADGPEAGAANDGPEMNAVETESPEAGAKKADGPEMNAVETESPEADAKKADGPETSVAADGPETAATDMNSLETAAAEADGPEAAAAETDSPEAAAEMNAPEAAAAETAASEASAPEAPYIPVREDSFLHRNSEPEPVTEEEILRANEDLLSRKDEEYRRLIGYDGLVKEEQEAVAAVHPQQAERARRRTRAAERTVSAGQPSASAAPENIPDRPEAPEAVPPVLARPSDDTPPVLVRPEDKKLSGPRVLGPRR